MHNYITLFSFLLILFFTNAQQAPLEVSIGGSVTGKVFDSSTNEAIEYANIAIYSTQDSVLVTGGITVRDGSFRIKKLEPGNYYATIKFIGYNAYLRKNIVISPSIKFADLGIIKLKQASQNLIQLNVVADKQQVMYKIDKKVINPSQFIASQGGSAVDILANTPSVSVDIEGNVTMRGSSSFMVLVNGRPTPFEPSDALAQIPASSIENIEIITNPSAKYDPDGASGIINIVTKKNAQQGWNGVVNANATTLGAYGGDFLFNFNGDKAHYYIGGNRRDRLRIADYKTENGNIIEEDTFFIGQDGERKMNFVSNSLKAGMDLDLDSSNILGIQVEGGQRDRIFNNNLRNKEWMNTEMPEITTSLGETNASSWFGSATLNHKVQFGDNKEHKLESSAFYQFRNGTDESTSTKRDAANEIVEYQSSWETGRSNEFRLKSDYVHPLENGKFEAGYQLRLNDDWSNYDAEFMDTVGDFYNETTYYRLINSIYGTYSGTWNRLGYQVGLRAEHTLRQLNDFGNDSLYEINRLDWYPTLHLSYALKAEQQIMVSYSRRIDRPRGYYLDPYLTWRDPNNVRQGNPGLEPEYINAIEFSYVKTFNNNSVSAELFHRNTTNKIERIRSSYAPNVLLTSYENVGKDYSSGMEVMLNYHVFKWWQVNLSGSFYDYRLDVTPRYESAINETRSTNYKGRMSNTFKPTDNMRIQFDGMYNSPTVSAQGTRSSMAYTSLAVKQSFFNRRLDASVSVIDLFDTARMNAESSGQDFFSNYEYNMRSPYLMFTLSYKFNNYKPERRSDGGGNMDMEE